MMMIMRQSKPHQLQILYLHHPLQDRELRYELIQSVQCPSELLIIVIEDKVKLCYPFLHDVKETDTSEAISPMFKRAALLLN